MENELDRFRSSAVAFLGLQAAATWTWSIDELWRNAYEVRIGCSPFGSRGRNRRPATELLVNLVGSCVPQQVLTPFVEDTVC